jgi:hypothetical protein
MLARNIENHYVSGCVRMQARESIRDHSANIVTDDVNPLQLELLSNLINILRHVCSIVTARSRRRAAYSAQINGNHGKLLREAWHNPVKRRPILRESMNQMTAGPVPPQTKWSVVPFTFPVLDTNPFRVLPTPGRFADSTTIGPVHCRTPSARKRGSQQQVLSNN